MDPGNTSANKGNAAEEGNEQVPSDNANKPNDESITSEAAMDPDDEASHEGEVASESDKNTATKKLYSSNRSDQLAILRRLWEVAYSDSDSLEPTASLAPRCAQLGLITGAVPSFNSCRLLKRQL